MSKIDRLITESEMLIEEGRISEAEDVLLGAVKRARNPVDSFRAYWSFGLCQHKLGRPEVAIESFDRALMTAPPGEIHAEILLDRAKAHKDAGYLQLAKCDAALATVLVDVHTPTRERAVETVYSLQATSLVV